MPQDAFNLKYLCEELNNLLAGGKVNRIVQPDNDRLVLTIYTGKRTEKLLLDVNPSAPRIGITSKELESPLTAPNFCMLMRKHLLSSTLDSIKLIGFDRIVRIDFTSSAEFSDAVQKTLYVELMGRYSNVILTQSGKILGGNRGINMFDNGVRPLIVGTPYVYPPTNGKRLPQDEGLIEYFENFNGDNFAEYIIKGVQGIALSTALEIEKAFIDNGNELGVPGQGQSFCDFLTEYLYNAKKNPCVTQENGEIKDVSVFEYSLVKGDKVFFPYLYLAEDFYFDEREKLKNYKAKKERLLSVTNSAIKKVRKKLNYLSAKQKEADGAEENRIKGELILANIYRIKSGQKECELENYYDGSTVKIALNENLSPSQNAENFYKKYNKQKRTLSALKPQKDKAEAELNYLKGVIDEIELCLDELELSIVQEELEQYGIIKENKAPNKSKKKERELQHKR